jgi:hypothetical protein
VKEPLLGASDPNDVARGCLNGIIISAVFWGLGLLGITLWLVLRYD